MTQGQEGIGDSKGLDKSTAKGDGEMARVGMGTPKSEER